MKKSLVCFLMLLIGFIYPKLLAQKTSDTPSKVYKVAVFAPLYLDSVFTNNNLRYDKFLPKFIMPAVEFTQGAEIAFDTLFSSGQHVEGFIYDTKSFTEPLLQLLHSKKSDSIDLIIEAVKDVDFKVLSDFSSGRNIPFISATFPNDGGVRGNPFLAIMNSTLK